MQSIAVQSIAFSQMPIDLRCHERRCSGRAKWELVVYCRESVILSVGVFEDDPAEKANDAVRRTELNFMKFVKPRA